MACASFVSPIEIFVSDEDGRRRHWSDEDKIRIVEESLPGYRQGSATARRYGISRSRLSIWRRQQLPEREAELSLKVQDRGPAAHPACAKPLTGTLPLPKSLSFCIWIPLNCMPRRSSYRAVSFLHAHHGGFYRIVCDAEQRRKKQN